MKGELLLLLPCPDFQQAESCFQHALALARRQHAKMPELRAALRLSRLWHQQGKGVEARELLAPVYSWFTEGFATADFQEARALLDELAWSSETALRADSSYAESKGALLPSSREELIQAT
jgi:predicted ATPase